MTTTRFQKWEGLGNDFVLLVDPPREIDSALIRRLCDRRLGIGADGILAVHTNEALPRMVVRNSDGSRPEMCGNGLRCVAGYLFEVSGRGHLTVETDAGERACEIHPLTANSVDVAVAMGPARQGPDLVVALEGVDHRLTTIDMGNPHAITFEPHTHTEFDSLGPAISVFPPGGTNVEFCRDEGDRIRVVVWERGVGRTLACGTGACAVAAAACDAGLAKFDEPVRIALPGGDLEIVVSRRTRLARMRGPARKVFSGELTIPWC